MLPHKSVPLWWPGPLALQSPELNGGEAQGSPVGLESENKWGHFCAYFWFPDVCILPIETI